MASSKAKAPADSYARDLATDAARKQANREAGRDIGPLAVAGINWARRVSCKFDLERFGRTYMANVFKLPSCRDHIRCNERMQRAFPEGGMFALAMPRGGDADRHRRSLGKGFGLYQAVRARYSPQPIKASPFRRRTSSWKSTSDGLDGCSRTMLPGLQEAKWVWRPDAADGMYRLSADVNRLKTFTMERLASPPGTSGSIVLPRRGRVSVLRHWAQLDRAVRPGTEDRQPPRLRE